MEDGKPQIMISYQWDSQTEVLKLYEALIGDGYKVWIDKKKMSENIYERMAEGVEESSIILLCMTKKYESSENCKSEYNYAKDCKKRIIPIYFERNYKAGGALAVIIAGSLHFSLTNKDDFSSKICELKGEIDKQLHELGECKIFVLPSQYSTIIRKLIS